MVTFTRADKVVLEPTAKWYFQQPLQKFGGGAPFWDSYVHDGCMVKSTTTENPFDESGSRYAKPG